MRAFLMRCGSEHSRFCALLLVFLCRFLCQAEDNLSHVEQQMDSQIGQILYGLHGGSGFFFGPNNDVVTAYQVLNGDPPVRLFCAGGKQYELFPKLLLPNYNIAILSTVPKATNVVPFKVGSFKDIKVGDRVLCKGSKTRYLNQPTKADDSAKVSNLGAFTTNGVTVDYFELEGMARQMYSGVAVFNSKGELIGIVYPLVNYGKTGVRAVSCDVLSSPAVQKVLSQRTWYPQTKVNRY